MDKAQLLKYGKLISVLLAAFSAVFSQAFKLKEDDGSFSALGWWALIITGVLSLLAVILHYIELQTEKDKQQEQLIKSLEEQKRLYGEFEKVRNPLRSISLLVSFQYDLSDPSCEELKRFCDANLKDGQHRIGNNHEVLGYIALMTENTQVRSVVYSASNSRVNQAEIDMSLEFARDNPKYTHGQTHNVSRSGDTLVVDCYYVAKDWQSGHSFTSPIDFYGSLSVFTIRQLKHYPLGKLITVLYLFDNKGFIPQRKIRAVSSRPGVYVVKLRERQ